MKVAIRKAKAKDLDALQDMFKALIKHESRVDPLIKLNRSSLSKAKGYYRKALRKSNSIILIAENENVPVGFIYGWIERTPDIFKLKKRGYICDAFVKKNFRERGIGTVLTKEILRFFKSKKVSWVKLTVYSKNINSVNVWRSLGFKDNMIEMKKLI